MDLSIVIVNYNVKYFIEQCLHSVYRAIDGIDAEVLVVDNNSVDGSCDMIREKFPWVKLIVNNENTGFSKANNQALKIAKGKFCLLLNPDTIVEEDTFKKCISFMNEHKDAGALGVHMIDGRGNFLPESKRSLPTPLVSFFKIFGFSSLFPKSKFFSRYHLGYLNKDENHEVDVLSGAFMFMRKEALDKTGYLDETFFMYGEDIDLSYRITKAGYKNYYFSGTSIIHYKGESTKKGSVNYVLVFYNAMIIFAKKHFSKKNARIFSILINAAIYFRAFLSLFKRIIKKIYQPLIDFILMFSGFYFLTPVWEKYKFGMENYYPDQYLHYIVPSYLLIWMLSLYYSGAYEKPLKTGNILKGHLSGTILILILYALLPESLRFSRAIILMGSVWVILVLLVHRLIFRIAGIKDYEFAGSGKKRLVLLGWKKEADRVAEILKKTRINPQIIGIINPGDSHEKDYLGNETQLREIVRIHKIDELVFCSTDLEAKEIIRYMTLLNDENIEYKIAPPESLSIIGSNSINTSGDLYLIDFNSIAKESNRRKKRLFDIVSSLTFILLSPLFFLIFKNFKSLFISSLRVLIGNNTWIGYCQGTDREKLPLIKPGIYELWNRKEDTDDQKIREKLNLEYARNYRLSTDFNLLWKSIS